jgi:hypothetical protein
MTPEQKKRLDEILQQVEEDDWLDEWLTRCEFELQDNITGYWQHQFSETKNDEDFLAWQVELVRLEQLYEELYGHD